MKTIKHISLLLFVMMTLASLTSKAGRGTPRIPEDFNAKNGVLLILNYYFRLPPEARERSLKYDSVATINAEASKTRDIAGTARDIMKEKYPYKYEFADAEDIRDNAKYGDKDLFRFVLVDNVGLLYTTGQSIPQLSHRFVIYDRKMDKQYSDISSGSYYDFAFRYAIKQILKYTGKK